MFAVAGPVDGDTVRMTNRGWSFTRAELARTLGLQDLKVLNDFVALAHGVPTLTRPDLSRWGWASRAGGADPGMWTGTGLGTALLVPQGDDFEVLPSEGGHVRFAR